MEPGTGQGPATGPSAEAKPANAPGTSSQTQPAETAAPFSLPEPASGKERNWAPLAIASVVVIAVVVLLLVMGRSRNNAQNLSTLPASPDPYAANLRVSNLAMSESSNLAGGKVTYLDGHIANLGDRTVTEVIVQVIFRDYAKKVAQSQRMPMTVIRMREPYIDTAPLSAAPLKPGAQADFRLNFDSVSPDWAGETPEVQILRVATQ